VLGDQATEHVGSLGCGLDLGRTPAAEGPEGVAYLSVFRSVDHRHRSVRRGSNQPPEDNSSIAGRSGALLVAAPGGPLLATISLTRPRNSVSKLSSPKIVHLGVVRARPGVLRGHPLEVHPGHGPTVGVHTKPSHPPGTENHLRGRLTNPVHEKHLGKVHSDCSTLARSAADAEVGRRRREACQWDRLDRMSRTPATLRTASSSWVAASRDSMSPCRIAMPFSTVTLMREL
jgi:hypothetical protein